MRRYFWLMGAFRAMGATKRQLAWATVKLVFNRKYRNEWYWDTSWHN